MSGKFLKGKFGTLAELLKLCKEMHIGDEGDFEFTGDKFPNTRDVANYLNDHAGEGGSRVFQCRVFQPPRTYAVRCVSSHHHDGRGFPL